MMLKLQDIKKGKENREEFWCTRCRVEGRTEDQSPYFQNFLRLGAPNPLSFGGMPWCHIFHVYGHRHEDCGYM